MGGRQQQGAALLMVMVVLAMLEAGMAWLVEDGAQVKAARLEGVEVARTVQPHDGPAGG